MRIFLAGATGVIGVRVVPLLVAEGHVVAGMTRSPDKAAMIAEFGALLVVCDAYDAESLRRHVVEFAPQLVMHQLTDLPDAAAALAGARGANARIRREGTANLVAAARAAGADRLLAQSIAWDVSGEAGAAKAVLEQMTLEFTGPGGGAGGVVLRYGQFYGPGTYHPGALPDAPRVEIGTAARRTVESIHVEPGILTITD